MTLPENPYDLATIWFGDKKIDARPADFDDLQSPTKALRYVTTCPHCYQLVDTDSNSENWIKECGEKLYSYCLNCSSGWNEYANNEPNNATEFYAKENEEPIMFYYSRENGLAVVPVHVSVIHLNGLEEELRSDDLVIEDE